MKNIFYLLKFSTAKYIMEYLILKYISLLLKKFSRETYIYTPILMFCRNESLKIAIHTNIILNFH